MSFYFVSIVHRRKWGGRHVSCQGACAACRPCFVSLGVSGLDGMLLAPLWYYTGTSKCRRCVNSIFFSEEVLIVHAHTSPCNPQALVTNTSLMSLSLSDCLQSKRFSLVDQEVITLFEKMVWIVTVQLNRPTPKFVCMWRVCLFLFCSQRWKAV